MGSKICIRWFIKRLHRRNVYGKSVPRPLPSRPVLTGPDGSQSLYPGASCPPLAPPGGGQEPPLPPEPALHYIRCALSYQNQLLSEIKTLLQQMVEQHSEQES